MINTLLYLGLTLAAVAGAERLRTSPYQNGFGIPCTTADMIRDCQEGKCVPTGRYVSVCSLCKPGKIPLNGVCVNESTASDYGDISVCQKNDATNPTHCISCSKNGSSNKYFLFYGGCYLTTSWPGNSYCLEASNGVCTKCNTNNKMIFINRNTSAPEKCILCSDHIGFGGSKGIQGCADCMDRAADSSSSSVDIQCLRCKTYGTAPIDDTCTLVGPHTCSDGYCTRCYKTHIFHLGGCFSRGGTKAEAICATANQFEIGNYSACKACVKTDEAPDQGNCKKHSERSKCTKDSAGHCSNCLHGNPINVFLFYGGCYEISEMPGGLICNATSKGLCTSTVNGSGVFLNSNGCYFCNDTANGGISSCDNCSLESGSMVCKVCKSGTYRSPDSKQCLTECTHPLKKYCSNDICICECEVGYHLSGGACVPCHESCGLCTGPTENDCEICATGWYWKYDKNDHLTCVGVDGCGDGFYADRAESACLQCEINDCRTCAKPDETVLCTGCTAGYISLNETACVASCTGENVEASSNGAKRCTCQDGYKRSSDKSTCVLMHPCPPDTSGCSRCDSAGYCMRCENANYVVQLNRKDCQEGCPPNSAAMFGPVCVCNDGSVLTDGACVVVTRRSAAATSTIAAVVAVAVVIVAVLVGVLCWYFLRNKNKGRPSRRARSVSSLSESIGLMGSADNF